jgi:isopropylmalate/homocitrate/citramalate synthase
MKTKKKIKIYEMFMRDGLQSLKPFSLEQKKIFLNQIMKNNYYCIEFGSTTNSKLLPQMSNSYDLFDYIKNINENTKIKYTMLVTNEVNNCIELGIKSFGLVCSISNSFAESNLKKSADQSIDILFNQLDKIILLPDYHVRLYVSCSFGELPDGNLNNESKLRLKLFLEKIKKKNK